MMVLQSIDTTNCHHHIHEEQPPVPTHVSPCNGEHVPNQPQLKCYALERDVVAAIQNRTRHAEQGTRNKKEVSPINYQGFQHSVCGPSLLGLPSL